MAKFRNIFIALGVLFLFAAGFSAWRSSHPAQSDEQILLSNLDDAVSAIRDRSSGRVMNLLAPEFHHDDTSRGDFNRMMTGAFWQWRDVQLDLSSQKVEELKGDIAWTSGHFALSYRPQEGSAIENHSGDFSLQWRKIGGTWKVVSASGGEQSF